jgi:ABC-2 type transport system ATP-binding protein
VQYASAPAFPVGTTSTLFLSGAGNLVATRTAVQASSQSYSNVGGGVPTSYSETSAVQGSEIPNASTPPTDTPGTFAAWKTAPLTGNLDVVGIPTATVHVHAPTTSSATAASELLFFAKIYDVAPDGSVDLVHLLVAPVRVANTSAPVTLTLPGIVHRFAKGHTIKFVIAATDAAYKNALPVQPVTVTSNTTGLSSLTLPVLSKGQATAALRTAPPAHRRATARPAASGQRLPATGSNPAMPVTALAAITVALFVIASRRRRRFKQPTS